MTTNTTNTPHKIGTHEIVERSDGEKTDYSVGDYYFDTLDEALLYSLVRTHSTAENPKTPCDGSRTCSLGKTKGDKMTFNFDNLKKIYDFIKQLPDEKVEMASWRVGPTGNDGAVTDLNVCGTAACVVGWLPVIFDEPTPSHFGYDQFEVKVGCGFYEAKTVCKSYRLDEDGSRPATRQDALNEMENRAKTYGHTLTEKLQSRPNLAHTLRSRRQNYRNRHRHRIRIPNRS